MDLLENPDSNSLTHLDGDRDTALSALRRVDPEQWDALHWLTKALHLREADPQAVLEAVLARATTVVPAAIAAGVNLLVRDRFEPQAVLGAAPPVLDELQQRDGTGPCIDASRYQQTISVDDLCLDDRWPAYGRRAAELGVRSMVCLPLSVDDSRLGSLSLYGDRPGAFDERSVLLAEMFALHAALAIAEAQRADHLQRALRNRDLIGQAKGVLMERHRITPDQAFELLSRASQLNNRKLVTIAETLTLTGELPGSTANGAGRSAG